MMVLLGVVLDLDTCSCLCFMMRVFLVCDVERVAGIPLFGHGAGGHIVESIQTRIDANPAVVESEMVAYPQSRSLGPCRLFELDGKTSTSRTNRAHHSLCTLWNAEC